MHFPARLGGERPASGAGAHADYENQTLLAVDRVGGLEVRTRSGEWISAPVVQGAFVVNIGDCLMRWTNDAYVSSPHRVVNDTSQERYSVAFFYDPDPGALVAAIPSCVPKGAAPLYAPVLAAEHLRLRPQASQPSAGTGVVRIIAVAPRR